MHSYSPQPLSLQTRKDTLIETIESLLNQHGAITKTTLSKELLEFMDEEALESIIHSLLDQKEQMIEQQDMEWLEKFKKRI